LEEAAKAKPLTGATLRALYVEWLMGIAYWSAAVGVEKENSASN
jgi:hypothetical protein